MGKSVLIACAALLFGVSAMAASPRLDVATDYHAAIAAVAPITGVVIPDPKNKKTWVIQFAPSATDKQKAAAATAHDAFTLEK